MRESQYTRLSDRGDRLILRKAEAAALLTERGYKVARKDMAALYSQIPSCQGGMDDYHEQA